MATLVPYSVQDCMDEIYVAVDNDPTSSTDSTQDEWTSRLRLINMAISAWERQDVIWNELWTLYTHAAVISASTQTYTIAATDYRGLPGSFLQFTDSNGIITPMDIINPALAQPTIRAGARKAYITGNARSGFVINFTFPLTATDQLIGQTMSLFYYKSAAKVSSASDVIEMSDPSYIVSYVAAKKNAFNGRADVAQDYRNDMQESMDNMRIRNEYTTMFADNRQADVDMVRDGDSLGM